MNAGRYHGTIVADLLHALHTDEFDLMTFDFHHRESLEKLRWKKGVTPEESERVLGELKAFQRLLRLCDNTQVASGLRERGFHSAHHVAALTESQFVEQHAAACNDDPEMARAIHQRATQVKARVQHLVANVRDVVASPYYRNTLFYNVDPELVGYFENIPSYQDLFGSQDFCTCEQCRSIFSPAAYFLDLMRMTDRYITDPSKKIPDGWHLEERRPDLFKMELTCEKTNRLVPTVQIANEVLQEKLGFDLKRDVFPELAVAAYPFNLPAQLPLEQVRGYLQKLGTSLTDIYRAVLEPNPEAPGFTQVEIAREYLTLTPEQLALLTTPDSSVAGVSRSYGYQDVTKHLPFTGPGLITIKAKETLATGEGVDFEAVLTAGQQIRVGNQDRTVVKINSPTLITLDTPWSADATGAPYLIFPTEDLSRLSTFLYRTQLSLDDLKALFTQGLSDAEWKAGLAGNFFINKTGEGLPNLQINWSGGGDENNPVARIEGLSLSRLDRVSRFVRLAARTGIPYATLDWLMVATGSSEITGAFILALANTKQVAETTGLTPEETAAFLHDMKTVGRGNGENPTDLFDRTFNNPGLLRGHNPYTEKNPIPFDPARPLSWVVGERPERPTAAGTAAGGSTTSITLDANASGQPGAYDGLSLMITAGTGKGQSRAIRRYDGATKVAEVYEEWVVVPDATSVYTVTNAPNLTNRLAAALQVNQTDLTAVGQYLQRELGLGSGPIRLDLTNLTLLYRLARLPALLRLKVDEYFVLRRLLFGTSPATDLLQQLQMTVTVAAWLRQSRLSVYELLYILTGERTRFLRLSYKDEEIPSLVQRVAAAAKSTYVSPEALLAIGLDEAQAAILFARLKAGGFIDAAGVLLRDRAKYEEVAKRFPIQPDAFTETGLITPEESRWVFTTLTAQRPPLLQVLLGSTSGNLTIDYSEATSLDFLFVASPNADQKRQRVRSVLNQIWQQIAYERLAPMLPVGENAFASNEIDALASKKVFAALAAASILTVETGKKEGTLSLGFDAKTDLSFLFKSQGAGQSRTVKAYDGSTRMLTVETDWEVTPDAFTVYQVWRSGQMVTQGTARAGTAATITLSPDATTLDGAYDGMEIRLVPDALAAAKIDQVRVVLLGTKAQVQALAGQLAQSQSQQEGAALSGLAAFFRLTAPVVGALVPYASDTEIAAYLPALLSPAATATVPPAVTALVDGLSRSNLMATKLGLSETELRAIARRPDYFQIDQPNRLTLADLRTLFAFKQFTTEFQDTGDGLLQYFDMPAGQVCPDQNVEALHTITGWDPEQICQMAALLWPNAPRDGLQTMQGLLRIQVPFSLTTAYGLDASFLQRTAALVSLRVGPIGGSVDQEAWNRYVQFSGETLSALASYFQDQEFSQISQQLQAQTEVLKRDALLGYAIWHFQTNGFPFIREPSDVYQFLLIDVEMGGCDSTSYIAQGINSVQLYMQRSRMGLEPGVTTQEVPEIWWTWISNYRLWEANRKVFLYPENYIEPTLRRDASPPFKQLIEELLQQPVTDEYVAKAYTEYFDEFAVQANLIHVGGYHTLRYAQNDEKEIRALYLVARTNTTPYTYYVRTYERITFPKKPLDEMPETRTWSPWQEVKLSINAAFVTPVYAFGRLFLFWTEMEPQKSSTLKDMKSESQSVANATIKYSFQSVSGDWVPAQVLLQSMPVLVQPNSNDLMKNDYIKEAFAKGQLYWQQPYVQSIARGIAGTGGLSFVKGAKYVQGVGTDFAHQISEGDHIWSAGERRRVEFFDVESQQMVVDEAWTVTATEAPFKVIPQQEDRNTFPPFLGTGEVYVQKGYDKVQGFGDNFATEVRIGDGIQVSGETRTVVAIDTETNTLIMDQNWTVSSSTEGKGLVTVFPKIFTVNGTGTQFDKDLKPGDQITVQGESRTVEEIVSATELTVTDAFNEKATDSTFWIGGHAPYYVIPQTDGAERLLIVYGPNFTIGKVPDPSGAGPISNEGDDPYIASLNQFNLNLDAALALAKIGDQEEIAGDATGAVAIMLGPDLSQQSLRMIAANSQHDSTATSLPVQTKLSRENDMLQIAPSENLIVSTYWANSAPGTRSLPGVQPAGGRDLLYHVDGDRSSVYGIGNQVGWYLFNNVNQSFLIASVDPKLNRMSETAFVQNFSQPGATGNSLVEFGPYTISDTPFDQMKFRYTRLTTNVVQPLKQTLFAGGIPALLTLRSQQLPELPFNGFYQLPDSAPPSTLDTEHIPPDRMDFDGAYGLYFQEIFFHGPLLVADQLKTNQRFSEAKQWYEYIFNPTGNPSPDDKHPNDRYWRYLPFRSMTIPTLRSILTNQSEIDAFNNDPFNPDAIARLRISAYAKATAMKYIDNLLKWGDALFTQDTRESITQATNLYILARDLLGPRPVATGTCPSPAPKSFKQIREHYHGDIPEFLIDLENSGLVPPHLGNVWYAEVPFNDIGSYFCIPENADFIAYWDRVEDRLFKIRHCMNIQGMERPLALFAPPIDPRSAILAFGASGGALSLASYAPMPIPTYRFSFLVSQAKSILTDVIRLGSSLLAALERKDVEALGVLRLTQESKLLSLTTTIKEQQVAEIDAQRDGLTQSLASATYRQTFYQDLIDQGLSSEEIAQIVSLGLATIFNAISTGLKTAAAIGYAVPQAGSPFAMTYGGEQIGANLQAAGAAMEMLGTTATFSAQAFGLSATYSRRSQEWELQKSLAGYDVAVFTAQLAANAIRKTIAERELEIHKTQLAQNQQLEQFYQQKFTNEELYNWMVDRIAATYFQAYSVAFDMARLAQRAYQFEYNTTAEYLTFGYWDSLRKGLTAGEGMLLAINQMEQAYVQQAARPLEIKRTISLRQLNPLALLTLIQTGECIFELPERLFDADYPGHYMRKIKTISVSVPAVVGPYQNIKATLTQTSNQILVQPNLDGVKFLLGEEGAVTPQATVLQSNLRNFQQIALSTGQQDTGLFVVDLNDPRYLPFEGTGAVSTWKLSLLAASNQFAFSAISDVIIELQYTALSGGKSFQDDVAGLESLRVRDWTRLVAIAQQDPSAWYAFLHDAPSQDRQQLRLTQPTLALPHIQDPSVTGFYLRLQVPDDVKTASKNPYITVRFGEDEEVEVTLTNSHSFFYTFPREIPVSDLASQVTISFNLEPGYTPPGLKEPNENRLNPAVLHGIDLVYFLRGDV